MGNIIIIIINNNYNTSEFKKIKINIIKRKKGKIVNKRFTDVGIASRRNRKFAECSTFAFAETECAPKVLISPHSAPKPKTKFGVDL